MSTLIELQEQIIEELEAIGFGRASAMLKANLRRRWAKKLLKAGYCGAHQIVKDAEDVYRLRLYAE